MSAAASVKAALKKAAAWLAALARKPKRAVRITLTAKGDPMLIRFDQKLPITAQPVDAQGNPAKLDGVPKWTLSANIGALAVAADGLSAVFTPTALGAAQLKVEGDADLGTGVRLVSGTLDLNVEGGEATTILVLPGTPIPK